jgi:hypothetical protein
MDNFYLERAESDRNEALSTLTQWKAARILIQNNLLGCEIHIAGMKLGVCDNSKLLPIINQNIAEINKFLKGLPNLFE